MYSQKYRDIKAGEEVCRAYIDVEGQEPNVRLDLLKESYGFTCECEPCTGKGKSPAPASSVTE